MTTKDRGPAPTSGDSTRNGLTEMIHEVEQMQFDAAVRRLQAFQIQGPQHSAMLRQRQAATKAMAHSGHQSHAAIGEGNAATVAVDRSNSGRRTSEALPNALMQILFELKMGLTNLLAIRPGDLARSMAGARGADRLSSGSFPAAFVERVSWDPVAGVLFLAWTRELDSEALGDRLSVQAKLVDGVDQEPLVAGFRRHADGSIDTMFIDIELNTMQRNSLANGELEVKCVKNLSDGKLSVEVTFATVVKG